MLLSDLKPYLSNIEYLEDELRCLDLCIVRFILNDNRCSMEDEAYHKRFVSEYIQDILDKCRLKREECNKITLSYNSFEKYVNQRTKLSLEAGAYLTIPWLSKLFNLDRFEEKIIIACIALEIDEKYIKIFNWLNGSTKNECVSVGLILKILCTDKQGEIKARAYFYKDKPLIKYLLNDFGRNDTSIPFILNTIQLKNRILNYVLEINEKPDDIGCIENIWDVKSVRHYFNNEKKLNTRLVDFFKLCQEDSQQTERNLVVYLYGNGRENKLKQVKLFSERVGLEVLWIDIKKIISNKPDIRDKMLQVACEAVLRQAVVCFENIDELFESDSIERSCVHIVEEITSIVPATFLLSRNYYKLHHLFKSNVFMDFCLDIPTEAERKKVWTSKKELYNFDTKNDVSELAAKFNFTEDQIEDAVLMARRLCIWRYGKSKIMPNELYEACRAQSNRMNSKSNKDDTVSGFDDIILPKQQKSLLKDVCSRFKYRNLVLNDWGLKDGTGKGYGINILFYGPSGTGKTMAAKIVANELSLELHKIDLTQIVSKYIGETEKNIDEIFFQAVTSNAVLFFDEADAVFGKRTEVKDAHDRYANMETAYLLQKMESHSGVVILATNLSKNIDEAFTRRMDFSIEFQLPDRMHRKKIWEKMLGPKIPSENIDIGFIADSFNLSGGNIRNVVLAAAYMAAEDKRVITMEHIIRAIYREYSKMGRLCLETDFGKYYGIVKPEKAVD